MERGKDNIAVLLLAAGASTRMGKIKQLLPWENTTLIGKAIENATIISKDIFVVLGANAQEIKKTLSESINIVENTHWKNGMGSSIAYGLSAIENKSRFDAVLIMLADQPLLDSDHFFELILKYRSNTDKIIATGYENKSGVPAIFNKSLFGELKKLNKDFGARQLIDEHSTNVRVIYPEKGTEMDIDTPEAYKIVKQSHIYPKINNK